MEGIIFVRLRLVLRLILAIIFATVAVLFSELIPPLQGTDPLVLRSFVVVVAAIIGYIVFPDLASAVTIITLTTFNFMVNRVSSEIMSQLLRLPRQAQGFNFMAPASPQVGSVALTRPTILDTSAIIDGRILDIAKTGFISGMVMIPQFVLTELQQVADSSDDLKRARGRRGFEVIEELKKIRGVKIDVWENDVLAKAVDDKLIKLAKNLHGRIVTTDYNLNRVATVSNVTVLNVNDLANAVKTVAIPGEKIQVKIMHLGKDSSQGVGYLPDGTMIVVSDAAEQIGQTLKVEVTKSLQIPAGRMIFAKGV